MNELKKDETQIIGHWIIKNGTAKKDENVQRIENLIKEHLIEITHDKSGWDTLFQDPEDARYWERIYLQGEMHGGGPPSLILIEEQEARKKYAF